MAFVVADRVRTTTTTTGTGTVTLGSPPTGYQSFAAIGNTNTTYYTIASQTLDEWEVGIGTYTASGTTLSRTTVLSSSNSGSLVNFSAGTKDVFVTLPASRTILQDDAGNTGVGTTVPGYKLDVRNNANSATYAAVQNTDTGGSASAGVLCVSNSGQGALRALSGSASFGWGPSAGTLLLESTASGRDLWITSAQAINFGTVNTARAAIDALGNFGIGTRYPDVRLDVQAANGQIKLTSTTGSNSVFTQYVNTGGNLYIGRENSAGTSFAAPAYSSVILSQGAYPFVINVNSGERMRIDSSGNLGLGVTPSAWGNFKAIQLNSASNGAVAAPYLQLFSNAYYNGANYIYTETGEATRFDTRPSGAAGFAWHVAPSGTAGNAISFTQAMTLDASGNLLIGATSSPVVTSKIYLSDGTISSFVGYKVSGVEYFGTQSSHPLAFLTANTERARINTSGTLLVGTTSEAITANGLKFFSDGSFYAVQNTGVTSSFYNKTGYTSGTEFFVDFRLADTVVGSISANGSTTSYNTSSDLRLKENIAPADDAGDVIDAISIVQHDWKRGGHVRYGVIAQDLNAVAPEAVTAGDDGVDVVRPWGVDYSKLVPILVKEIQSLRARVAALEGG